MMAAAGDRGYNYGVRSGAFCCKLSGIDWFMLGCAMTGGR